jgi:hypothetical protein
MLLLVLTTLQRFLVNLDVVIGHPPDRVSQLFPIP